MKRDCLEHANVPDHPAKGSLDELLASIAWLGDNEGHGIKDACKNTIDKARHLFAKMSPTFLALPEDRAEPIVFDWERFRRAGDGSLDLRAAYIAYCPVGGHQPEDPIVPPILEDFFRMLDETHPIKSRQVASLALAQAIILGRP